VLSDIETELKEKAKQLTFAAGRNTVTKEDMRQAVEAILGTAEGEVDEPGSDDA
jgi:histone H3/H4